MAIIRCKMCGGNLVFDEGATVGECEYCGSKQTIPTVDSEKKMKLFDRANRLRINSEFDKAGRVYESIIEEFPEEAEGYWGYLLCKYGIEYVDDPVDGSKVPTCHRSSFESFMDDEDFEMVMENADVVARVIYREQAKQIEEIRKGIVEVSAKEQPYDIFICYKETNDNGDRTLDSVLAQNVYESLTAKGYRVFFSRISLEDKLGTEYEPYIFAALNSAKIMLAFGTSYDYYNAVWVKNEWSRFLRLMAKDKTKHLIPCYKDVDAYDIPKEFAKLQAQDMGKVGAMQDLMRGIDKLMGKDVNAQKAAPQTITQQVYSGPTADSMIERGNMSLADGEYKEAVDFFNRALDMDPRSSRAYLGLLMADMQVKNPEAAKAKFIAHDYSSNRNWNRTKQFASEGSLIEFQNWESERNTRLAREAEEKKRKCEKEEEEKRREKETLRLNEQLFSAIEQGDPLLVKIALRKGADPNSERRDFKVGRQYSALRASISIWPNDEIANLLIDAGADVNYAGRITDSAKNVVNVPVLSLAILKGNVAMVKRLLEKGADPNCERIFSDGRHFSALNDSILEWPNDTIADLLIEAGADVNYMDRNINFKTPVLYSAVCKSNVAMVKKLLRKGADPNREQVFDSGARFSPLYGSVIVWPNKEIARELVTAGADGKYEANYSNGSRSTILSRLFLEKRDAASKLSTREKLEFVDILLDGGADFYGDNRIRKMNIYNRYGVPKEIFIKMKQAGWDPGLF